MTSNNIKLLENTVIVCLPIDRAATEPEVGDLAARLRTVFPVPDDEFDMLLHQLRAKLSIVIDT